jgi:hypothetical protein
MSSTARDFLARATERPRDAAKLLAPREVALRPRGSAIGAKVIPLDAFAREGAAAAAGWNLATLRGRFVEISGHGATATLTAALALAHEAQREGEPVAWLTLPRDPFYVPDLVDSGIDLDALVVMRQPTVGALVKGAEYMLRSGGFGLVVFDFVDIDVRMPAGGGDAAEAAPDDDEPRPEPWPPVDLSLAQQGLLSMLALRNGAVVACLTDKPDDAEAMGSPVSVRAAPLRTRRPAMLRAVDGSPESLGAHIDPAHPAAHEISIRFLKDKMRGPMHRPVRVQHRSGYRRAVDSPLP